MKHDIDDLKSTNKLTTAKGCHRLFRINAQHQALTTNANTLNYYLSQYTDSVLLLHADQLQEIMGVGFVPDLEGLAVSGGAQAPPISLPLV